MIKKILLPIFMCLVMVVSADAAKSAGTIRLVQQPDGTMLSIQLLGDEHFSWYQTTDGVLLIEKDKVFYVGTVTGTATLESSGIVAHNFGTRSAEEQTVAANQDKDQFFKKAEEEVSQSKIAMSGGMVTSLEGYPSSSYCPHKGTVKVPVILMRYADMDFSIASTADEVKKIFNDYFNSTTITPYTEETVSQGYGSVAQYFKDASYNKLNFQFDIYGPYTADNNHDSYGHNNGSGRQYDLLPEAVLKADGDINFAEYDSNNDGKVDMVYILYAGTGANLSNNENDFWPACYCGRDISTQDGKTINVIGGANELADANMRAGIGVTCHEISHGMGLPDLYYNFKQVDKNNNCGPEMWDLMDGGENIYLAIWPCQYAAWEKEVMGWLDVEDLTEAADITVYPLNDTEGRGKAYRVTNPDNSNEYYIIEALKKLDWNYYVCGSWGSGLMITHVNMSSTGLEMHCNTTAYKPNLTLLPADGLLLASYNVGEIMTYKGEADHTITTNDYSLDLKGDPYPGTSNVTSLAAYKNYTGDEMVAKYPITDITKNADGSISFKFMGGAPTAVDVVKDQADKDLDVKKYVRNGKVVIMKNGKEYNMAGAIIR